MKKPPKSRNPIAKNLKVNIPKVIPDKRNVKLTKHILKEINDEKN